MAISNTLTPWAPRVLSIVRIMAGLIFMAHGTQKLLGFPAGERAFVEAFTPSWWGGLLELILGALIVVGLFTRLAAFIASLIPSV